VAALAALGLVIAGCGADSAALEATGPGASVAAPAPTGAPGAMSAGGAGAPSAPSASSSTTGGGATSATTAQGASTPTQPSGTGAQPAQPGQGFQSGAFAGLPLPGGSQPVNAPQETHQGTLRSWKVTGVTPEQVLQFYAEQLPPEGWTVAEGPGASGATDWAGTRAKADQVLRVTASPFEGDAGQSHVSQLNLQLTNG
jgi:hypothetical protein